MLLWCIAAVGVGILVVAQPIPDAFFVLSLLLVGMLAVITPLSALVVLLIVSPLRVLIATESPSPLSLDIGQITFAGFGLSCVVWQAVRRQPLLVISWTPLLTPLLIFIAISGASAFSASSVGMWLNEWLKWFQIVLLVVVVMNMVQVRQWLWLIFGLVLAGVANALVGMYEFLGGSGALHLAIDGRFFRAFGTFGQPNPFGGFMGLLLPIALMLTCSYSQRVWWHWRMDHRLSLAPFAAAGYYLVSSSILLSGLLVSWSRGAWLGFAVSLAALALALPRKVWQGVVFLAILGSLLAGFWFAGLLPSSVVSRINSATEEYFTFADVRGVTITPENYPVVERLAHWQAALSIVSEYPWLGVGLGNYEVAYGDNRLINWQFALGHAHNYYLNILAEAGIIGLLGYGNVWLGIIWLTWRVRGHPDPVVRYVAVGLLGSWVYLAVHSLFDNLYVNNVFIHMGLMLAVLAVLYNQTWRHYKVRAY